MSTSADRLYMSEDGGLSFRKVSANRKKAVVGLIVAVALVALIVGLAVGLGTRRSSPNPPPHRCLTRSEMRPGDMTPPTTKWIDTNCLAPGSCPAGFSSAPLLIISLDGFRPDYLQRNVTPTLKKLSECGVRASHMRAVYPTKTFPNHYSIVTGLYPESHGIIDNSMYDRERKQLFSISAPSKFDSHWWGGDPFWLTAMRQGKRAASFFWPGSDSPVQGLYPDICYTYDHGVPFRDRIAEVMGWLDLPGNQRPDFMALYFHEPDSAGHQEGPYGRGVDEKLAEVDSMMSLLMDGLVKRNLDKCINIMIVADHGMEETSCRRLVRLPSYVNTSNYYIYDGANGRMTSSYIYRDGKIVEQPGGDTPDQIVDTLQCRNEYMEVNKKEDIPRRHHYANNPRIDEVIMDVKAKWLISRHEFQEYCSSGNHGYDELLQSMHSLFLAYGKDIVQQRIVESFDSIELYNLMGDLMGVNPSPNNGTAGALRHLMKSPPALSAPPPPVGAYSNCPYPSPAEEENRRNSTTCTCPGRANHTSKSVKELNDQLNLNAQQTASALRQNLPTGTPEVNFTDTQPCQLNQSDYVSGYSHEYRMPLWTAYQLKRKAGYERPNLKSRLDLQLPDCLRPDVRLPLDKRTECSSYTDQEKDIVPGFLFPPGFANSTDSQFDALISSNLVPMYRGFAEGVWRDAMELVEEYAYKYETVQVTAGPLFDYDADGHRDPLASIRRRAGNANITIPSHFYVILTKCDNNTCQHPQPMAMVLPHKHGVGNCKENDTFHFMQMNTARVRDVELLTGLNIFTSVDQERRLQMRIHTEEELWERNSWLDSTTCTITENNNCPAGKNPLLLISIDGFRPDYLLRNLTPTIQRLTECGTSTPAMMSVYPTLTFPNHYTQVTGLYPESNGIISNSMYDLPTGAYFSLPTTNKSDPRWWQGEPIWNTVEKHNKTSMCYFWPGSDNPIQYMRPTRYMNYNGTKDNDERVDTVLDWLAGSEGVIPDFVTLYFSSVDSAGHYGGYEKGQIDDALIWMDRTMKRLMDTLYRRGTHDCVNIMIVSDHGMSDVDCLERQSGVREHMNERNMHIWEMTSGRISNEYRSDTFRGPFYPVDKNEQIPIDTFVNRLECRMPGVKVFEKHLFPKRHHYASHHRVDSIILDVDDRWLVAQWKNSTPFCNMKGNHGWEETAENMQAYFCAHGPAFKTETVVEPFSNIELYNIMARVLDVEAVPNNGTEGALYPILKTSVPLPSLDTVDRYTTCPYQEPVTADDTCSCDQNKTVEADRRLNTTQAQNSQTMAKHLPHGQPTLQNNDTVCLLFHDDFISAYSHDRKMAVWSAYTLNKNEMQRVDIPNCLRFDPRVNSSSQQTCQNYRSMEGQNVTQTQLFPPEFSTSNDSVHDTLVLTNSVPVYKGSVIWEHAMEKVRMYAERYNRVHVVAGPAFDYDYDGHWDPISLLERMQPNNTVYVPSHYFLIILKCSKADCETKSDYDVQAFILPHIDRTLNCMQGHMDLYLEDNTARIRDIELLTGFQFLTKNNTQEALNTRLRLQHKLWMTS